jgi:hypothetical protein
MEKSDFLCIANAETNEPLHFIRKSAVDAVTAAFFSERTRSACEVRVNGAAITIPGMRPEEVARLVFPCLGETIDEFSRKFPPKVSAESLYRGFLPKQEVMFE